MINAIFLTGIFKGYNEDNEMLLKVESMPDHKIVKINISKSLQEKVNEFVKENNLIGVKGYIELDDIHNIVIIATKITFLSDNQKAQK